MGEQTSDDDTATNGATQDADRPDHAGLDIESLLAQTEALGGNAKLSRAATAMFQFAQFLLDDDDNLTKTGNLNGEAKGQFQRRVLELLGVDEEDGTAAEDSSGDSASSDSASSDSPSSETSSEDAA